MLDSAGFDLSRSLDSGVEGVAVLTTESRSLTREQASERVAQTVMAPLNASGGHILFKKVDSTGRGHFGAETMALLDASGAALALVAPAFPLAGRTVAGGILEVRDAAEQHLSIPLRDLFAQVDARHIDVLACGSETAIRDGVGCALARGVRVLLCDSKTQEDLERLARVVYRVPQPVLWTGSAGLAHALAVVLPALRPGESVLPARPNGRSLVFVGTEHPVTKLQVTHLERRSSAQDVANWRMELHRVQWSNELNIPSGEEIRAAFSASPVSALILTGGDTAAFVLRALGAAGILLGGEIARGIPWGIVEGGDADGCMVITKSGGFGSREALADAVDFSREICNRRNCAPA